MDIIQIDSSESEDDIEISDEAPTRSFSDDAIERLVAQRQDLGVPLSTHPSLNGGDETLVPKSPMRNPGWRMISSANLGNDIRDTGRSKASIEPCEGPSQVSEQDKHAEPDPWKNCELGDLDAKSPLERSQRRALPSSFQQAVSKPVIRPSFGSCEGSLFTSRQKEPALTEHNRESKVNLNNILDNREKCDEQHSQNSPKRPLPQSMQPAALKTSPGSSLDHKGDSQVRKFLGTAHSSIDEDTADHKVDGTGKKSDEFGTHESNGYHRVLPSSVINGKSLPDAKPKASTDTSGKGELYASSCYMKANAADGSQRFPPKAASESRSDLPFTAHGSSRDDASDHKVGVMEKKNAEFFAYKDNGKYRVLPSTLRNDRHVANSQEKAATETRGKSFGNSSNLVEATACDGSRRFLPPTFNNENALKPSSKPRGKNDFLVKSSNFVGASASNGVQRVLPSSFMNEKSIFNYTPKTSTESRDDVHAYGDVGTYRVLPPSLTHGKSVNGSLLVGGARDAQSHSGLVEDRRIESDGRLIYQEALQNLSQSKLEDDLPEGLLAVPLLKHQKIALAWMVLKEKSSYCTGGILADDQGLGKTVSMIALIQKQMSQQSKFMLDSSNQIKPEALNLDEDDDGVSEVHKTRQFGEDGIKTEQMASTSMCVSRNSRPAAGTLVVCPASVLQQWAREVDEKVTDTARLSVLIYHGGARTKNPTDLAKYDVVLTTYTIVTNEVPKQSLGDDDDEQRNLDRYGISSEFSSNKKRKQTSNGRSKGKKKGKGVKSFNLDLDGGPLARVRWFRVILDEAQTTKNHRTQVARACCGLRAKRRWCLSGTPIQNAIDDLYSYFRFLKYEPYCVYSAFCSSIKYPISRDPSRGYRKLQALLKVVLLRRTKGTLLNGEPILNLPPKLICLKRVEFSSEERAFYLRLEANSRQQFKEYAAAGTLKQNYANILLMLLRLRQACDHPLLVKGYRSDTSGKDSLDMARQLPRDMLLNLLNQLEGSMAICSICSDTPEDAVVTMCGHVFCYQCVSEHLTGDDNVCPAVRCRDVLDSDSVFSQATLRSCISDEDDSRTLTSSSAYDEESSISQSSYISSKIRAALDILKSILYASSETSLIDKDCNESDCCSVRTYNLSTDASDCNTNATTPTCGNNRITDGSDSNTNSTTYTCGQLISNPKVPVKAIVFSQWTSMLDLVEFSLNASLIQYRRLDGTMSLSSRDRAVKEFNTDPEVSVMLMSLKAGNLGLNMTAACHVILLDLWWNPSTEDQAVDRAHRIGQTRPVTVSRLTIKDTVEDRILALQEEKRKLISSAFGEDQSHGVATRLTVEDLRYLFMV